MFDLAELTPRHRARKRYPRVTVASEVTPDLNDAILVAVRLLDSNKSKVISACIQVGLPIVLQQATHAGTAADQRQS